jgi:hypothetical protein
MSHASDHIQLLGKSAMFTNRGSCDVGEPEIQCQAIEVVFAFSGIAPPAGLPAGLENPYHPPPSGGHLVNTL